MKCINEQMFAVRTELLMGQSASICLKGSQGVVSLSPARAYVSVSSAAVVDLNGRYFGGRVVKACFYNLDKFRVFDLGEQV